MSAGHGRNGNGGGGPMAPRDMTCTELVEMVTGYLENALDEDERTRLELHVVACTGCAAYVREFGRTIELVRRAHTADIPPGVRAGLIETFRRWEAGREEAAR